MTKARVNADNASADIQGVTAGTGLTGGGTSGTVTLNLDTTAVIQPTIFDAKADLLTATADNTPARLAVGNNGETLVADSSASTGLRWQGTQAAGKNYLINGSMDIWQRGTSFSAPTNLTYTADRWFSTWGSANRTVSRQTGFSGANYCIRVARNSGATDTNYTGIQQIIESANVYPLQGKTVTLSFDARKGANFSSTDSKLFVGAQSGTGIDQGALSAWNATWTGNSYLTGTSVVLTTTATRYSVNFTIPSDATELAFTLYYQASGTAGAADYFEATNVQLELGSVATTFTRAGGTLAGEFEAACRYYWRITKDSGIIGHMYKYLSGDGMGFIELPVPMRVTPTSMDILNVQFQQTNLTNNAIFGPTLNTGYSTNKIGAFTFGQTGLASGTQGYAALTSSGYIGFSAEL